MYIYTHTDIDIDTHTNTHTVYMVTLGGFKRSFVRNLLL